MSDERWPRISYPGALQPVSVSITMSHGITPSVMILKINPQEGSPFPAAFGDLVIWDGVETITIPNCRMNCVKSQGDVESGRDWYLELVDRRWKWRGTGAIFGNYNQLDARGKLIPRTIRSPFELAKLCLDAMGEVGYTIDMPAGIPRAAGAGTPGFLPTGINFPVSGCNPAVSWGGEPPSQVLENLVNQFGRHIVYNLVTNTVDIIQIGQGADLPPGSVRFYGPSNKSVEAPDGIGVFGDPTKIQMRLKLEAVGLEWDQTFRPLADLSYGPLTKGQSQITRCKVSNPSTGFAAGGHGTWTLILHFGQGSTCVFFYTDTDGATPERIVGKFIQQIQNDVTVSTQVSVSMSGSLDTLIITELQDRSAGPVIPGGPQPTMSGKTFVFGSGFTVVLAVAYASYAGSAVTFTQITSQPSIAPGDPNAPRDWSGQAPGAFAGVQATSRLSRVQAMELAEKSVWKYYRVVNQDVSGRGLINVPGYGRIPIRENLQLLDTKVDPIVPGVADGTIQSVRGPIILDYYNGLSKEQPAMVFGQHSVQGRRNHWYAFDNGHLTPPGSRILVPFSIDKDWQVVMFAECVFQKLPGAVPGTSIYKDPGLILETGVQVRDANTNQFIVFSVTRALAQPGEAVRVEDRSGGFLGDGFVFPRAGTNYAFEHKQDVQLCVTSTYDDNGNIRSVQPLEVDPFARAKYYLDAMMLKYQYISARTAEYNGLVFIPLDGAIHQLTWDIEVNVGVKTTISMNNEHSVVVPRYPNRRRNELVDPDAFMEFYNRLDRDAFDFVPPR